VDRGVKLNGKAELLAEDFDRRLAAKEMKPGQRYQEKPKAPSARAVAVRTRVLI